LGGLAVAIARSAMAGEAGVDVDLGTCPDLTALPPDVALFSESNGRFVITAAQADASSIEALFMGLPCRRVGTVTAARRVRLAMGPSRLLDVDLDALKTAYQETLRHA